MELSHWVIRTLFGLLLVNLFIGGLYAFLRGYMTKKIYKKYWHHSLGHVKRYSVKTKNKMSTYLEWQYMGQIYSTGSTQFYMLGKQKSRPMKIYVKGHRAKMNTWAYNGIGLMILGVTLLSSALLGIFLLL